MSVNDETVIVKRAELTDNSATYDIEVTTWRDLRSRLNALSDEQLAQPIQIAPPHCDYTKPILLQPAVCFGTLRQLFAEDDGVIDCAIQPIDGTTCRLDDVVLVVDGCPHDRHGDFAFEMVEDGMVGMQTGRKVAPLGDFDEDDDFDRELVAAAREIIQKPATGRTRLIEALRRYEHVPPARCEPEVLGDEPAADGRFIWERAALGGVEGLLSSLSVRPDPVKKTWIVSLGHVIGPGPLVEQFLKRYGDVTQIADLVAERLDGVGCVVLKHFILVGFSGTVNSEELSVASDVVGIASACEHGKA